MRHSLIFTILFSLSLGFSSGTLAAVKCGDVLTRGGGKTFSVVDGLVLSEIEAQKVKTAMVELGLNSTSEKSVKAILKDASKQLEKKHPFPDFNASDKMSKLIQTVREVLYSRANDIVEVDGFVETVPAPQTGGLSGIVSTITGFFGRNHQVTTNETSVSNSSVTTKLRISQNKPELEYFFTEHVMKLERIPDSEIVNASSIFSKNPTFNFISVKEIVPWVNSFIKNEGVYPESASHSGVIGWPEIRDTLAQGIWLSELKPHDMKHLRFSMNHPYFIATVYRAARSGNDLRYMTISGLWESVDTFRTTYESNIAKYFKQKGMALEEAILFLGTATQAQLKEVHDAAGGDAGYTRRADITYGTWKIKALPGSLKARQGSDSFDENINTMIREIKKAVKESPEGYYNYRNSSGPTNGSQHDPSIQ